MNELRAFADGRWPDFRGLAACTVAMADADIGPPLEDRLHGGRFGAEPTQFRRYPGTAAAPGGVTVWVLGDVVVGLEVRDPAPPSSTLEELGAPERTISSELGAAWSQELWPSRGLVLHRRPGADDEPDRIAVGFGLAPFDVDAWEDDPLRWWRVERRSSRA